MKPDILTRESLSTINRVIDKNGGSVSIRFLLRNHYVQRWQVNAAVVEGFISLEQRKPRTGRPALMVSKVSNINPTQLPPSRYSLEDCISFRHWNFAFYYALGEIGPGLFSFRRRAYVAYQRAFPTARSKAGAKASASRLLSQPHIQAAIQWSFAQRDQELDCHDLNPQTTTEIWDTLHALGSFRAKWAPYWIKSRWT